MSYRVRFTDEAVRDLERLYDFLLAQAEGDWTTAERALASIREAIRLLEHSPFSCRKATADSSFVRELIIPFGSAGYVALFEIDDARTVTVLACRHQREDDFH